MSDRVRSSLWSPAVIAAGLFVAGLATRLPLGTENLWAHDSVLYERAVERFDPLDQRPQAPGYLYYILLLRALVAVTGDANRAMTLVSGFAGAAAIALLYLFVRRLYDERTGLFAAAFLFTSVTFWAYGGLAYPYTLLGLLTITCAWLFWRATVSSRAGPALVVASAAWGVAIGFRSDLAIFLAPLWLLAATGAGIAWSAASALAVAAFVAAWIGLSAAAGNGLAAFLEANRAQSEFIERRYSVFGGGLANLQRNAYELSRFVARALYALAPLVGALLLSRDALRAELRDRRRVIFVALWTLAPLPFYLLIHVGEYGYVFTMLPGLCVVAARGAIALVKAIHMPRLLPWVVGLAAAANAAIFLFTPTPLSRDDLARRDHGISEKVAYVRQRIPPAGAVIVTAFDQLLIERYIGSGYALLAYDPDAEPRASRSLAAGTRLVVWDDVLRTVGPEWQPAVLEHGARLRIARLERASVLEVRDGLELGLAP